MLPPPEGTVPGTGPCAPFPGAMLILGGGRWLLMNGRVVTYRELGYPVELNPRTYDYWEDAAIRSGSTLVELIV